MEFNFDDILSQVERGKVVLTKFLDESEQAELESNLSDKVKVQLFGGYQNAERKRALITEVDYDFDDFNLVAYRIDFPRKFTQINHRHVLGTIMSLGVNRNTIGDIIIGEDTYLIVTKEIAKYLIDNLTEINRTRVTLTNVDLDLLDELNLNEPIKEEIIVSSLRLDAIVAQVMNVSRNDASKHIMMKNVKINHKICEKTSQICKINDIISIRKYGRVVLLDIKRVTRKERIVLSIGIWR